MDSEKLGNSLEKEDLILKKIIQDYWANKLLKVEGLGADGSKRSSNFHSGEITVSLKDKKEFGEISKGNPLSEYTLYLTLFAVLLKKYFNRSSLPIVSSDLKINNEPILQDHKLFYVLELPEKTTLKEYIKNVQSEIQQVIKYRRYNFGELFDELMRKQSDGNLRFPFSLVYDKVNQRTELSEFTLSIHTSASDLKVRVDFDESIYSNELANQFLRHFKELIRNIRGNIDLTFSEINYLTDLEKEHLLNNFIRVNEKTLPQQSIIDLFKTQVARVPDKIAVVFEDQKWTYKQLDELSDKLASHLKKEFKISENKLVGILVSRSYWVPLSMLAVLKAGGSYVPIDPHNPKERIELILADSKPEVILIQSDFMFDLTGYTGNLFALDIELESLIPDESSVILPAKKDDLAYVLYTSGTTGKPKGVMIEHSSLLNYVEWFISEFDISEDDSTVLLSSYAFDLGYTSLWGSLVSGATLHILSEKFIQHPDQLVAYIQNQAITFIKATPSLFQILMHIPDFYKADSRTKLRLVLLGGESIIAKDIEQYQKFNSNTEFVNHYGPTEATIGSIFYRIKDIQQFKENQILGNSIHNHEAYVLDGSLGLLPFGVAGELCIGGAGLAKGYYENEKLTRERFVDNPFKKGERIYRTGDVVKRRFDGAIEFLGRNDDQVKVKGYRVELNEIKSAFLRFDLIENVEVVVNTTSDRLKELNAYFVSKSEIDQGELRAFLKTYIPDYMIPTNLIPLKFLPVTDNGKIDKKALPDPKTVKPGGVKYEAPRNETEEKFIQIWQSVLEKSTVGINDNIFDIGASSLKIVQAFKLIDEHYPQVFKIGDFFDHPTVAKQVALYEEARGGEAEVSSEFNVMEF